ncbi:SusD/RagB family nutrient-binding outer membrane lipoprotein [Hymenobacter weizhouensis]|uniref:SusD/RagB family nutrient-binding outer membrane lipoprotein n=1 Tax=Hymenobacter sp. YIM 151500-1 TaxID=2987689 RepID=UPI002227A403|nr:SusD/RagB family nutrient-binding outer membrane lipoprotein [Hymenobacter sp. YIM 151500-1]UYZ63431.1 SusD/RagB family nutrient-binding outer membrane lipoprotein [Hymenobacter sp. YIM 151500-1]
MKKHILALGLLLGGGLMTSCDSFLDVNDDPNNPVDATANFLLPGAISQAFQQQMLTALTTPYITQYIVRRPPVASTDQFFLTTGNGNNTFNYFYFYSAGNAREVLDAAQKEGSPHYVGAAKIVLAMGLAHLTDMMGDVPYSEAFRGAQNFTPKYDPQEQLYQNISQLLDEGIAEMQKPASANFRPLYITAPSVSGDILYRGNTDRWIRLAKALKARQLHHLTKKSNYVGQVAPQVLQLVSESFQSSADDAQIQFEVAVAPLTGTTNIFGTTRAQFATASTSATFSSNIIKYLNGNAPGATYAGVVDPRFPIIATPISTGTDPGVNGGTPISAATGNATDFYSSWYARDLGYFEIITFHELKFIEAEAALLTGDKARAFRAYREGITAHMRKIGVGGSNAVPAVTFPVISQAQIDAYLASAAVAQTPDQVDLRRILEQKYISMFLNPETWSDLRRHDFDPALYVNLRYPVNANTVLANQADYKNRWPRRLPPALTETQYNPQNVAAVLAAVGAAGTDDYITKPVWWDQR